MILEEKQFKSKDICRLEQFREEINKLDPDKWIFRGQEDDWPLKSTLERALEDYGFCLNRAKDIEKEMIRDFRRRYAGLDRDLVLNDTLFCLSLMQHHGAPTRLLDWNYSPYVAVFFALEEKLPKGSDESKSVLWCLNTEWCLNAIRNIQNLGEEFIRTRSKKSINPNEERTDESFIRYYMSLPPTKFVFAENPFLLNERLRIQQGVFLCPGDVSIPLEQNIKSLDGWDEMGNIVKFRLKLDITNHKNAIKELLRMNVGRESLFPGLDGFSKSFKQRLLIYD
jgi:hypothetical protein